MLWSPGTTWIPYSLWVELLVLGALGLGKMFWSLGTNEVPWRLWVELLVSRALDKLGRD